MTLSRWIREESRQSCGEIRLMHVHAADAYVSSERLPYRSDIAMLGIYEISKALCGPGSLQEVLAGTLYVLHSFLDMGTGMITLLDDAGDPEQVFSASHPP